MSGERVHSGALLLSTPRFADLRMEEEHVEESKDDIERGQIFGATLQVSISLPRQNGETIAPTNTAIQHNKHTRKDTISWSYFRFALLGNSFRPLVTVPYILHVIIPQGKPGINLRLALAIFTSCTTSCARVPACYYASSRSDRQKVSICYCVSVGSVLWIQV